MEKEVPSSAGPILLSLGELTKKAFRDSAERYCRPCGTCTVTIRRRHHAPSVGFFSIPPGASASKLKEIDQQRRRAAGGGEKKKKLVRE